MFPGHFLLLSLAQATSPFTWPGPPQPLGLRLYITLYVSFRIQLRCHLFLDAFPDFSSPQV